MCHVSHIKTVLLLDIGEQHCDPTLRSHALRLTSHAPYLTSFTVLLNQCPDISEILTIYVRMSTHD